MRPILLPMISSTSLAAFSATAPVAGSAPIRPVRGSADQSPLSATGRSGSLSLKPSGGMAGGSMMPPDGAAPNPALPRGSLLDLSV
jgi:hypothetical protein